MYLQYNIPLRHILVLDVDMDFITTDYLSLNEVVVGDIDGMLNITISVLSKNVTTYTIVYMQGVVFDDVGFILF